MRTPRSEIRFVPSFRPWRGREEIRRPSSPGHIQPPPRIVSIPLDPLQYFWPTTVKPVIEAAEVSIKDEIESVSKLAVVASKSPYYKYASRSQLES
jgi:hypothetical protein